MSTDWPGGWIIAAAAAAAAIFLIDVLTPLGVAVPMLYVIPILLTWLVPGSRITVVIAGCSLIMTVLGVVLSPGEVTIAVIADRAIASTLLLVVATLLHSQKQSARRMAILQQDKDVSEERFRMIFEHAAEGIVITDEAANLILCNAAYCSLLGYSPEELSVRHFSTLTHPDDRAQNLELVRQLLDGKRSSFEVENRYVTKFGAPKWVRKTVSMVRDDRDSASSFLVLATDVTARKQAEEALRVSEEQLRLFIEHAPAAIAMFDCQMHYLALSQRWKTEYGIMGNVVGRSHYEVFPEIPDRWKEAHRRGLAGEVVQADEDPFPRNDGSVQWTKWEVHPWYMGTEVGGIMIMAEEITSRVQARLALERSEERLRQVLEKTHTGIWDWEIESGKVFWTSQSFLLLGYEVGSVEPSYERWATRMHPEDREKTEAEVRDAMAQQREYHRQFRCIWPDGTIRWIEAHGSFKYGRSGQCERMMGLMRDITERKHVEEALRVVQARQRLLLTATPVVLYTCRTTENYGTTFISENVREQLGYSAQDFTTDSEFWLAHLHPDDRPWVIANLTQAVEQVRQVQEYRFLHHDGMYRWLHDESRLIRDPDGVPRELVGFQIDITERKQVEELLRQQQTRLENLAAQLLITQEHERRRIARDLHDDITQRVAALAIDLRSLRLGAIESSLSLSQPLHDLGVRAEQLTTDLQRLAHQLHPSILEHVGLEAAVREHVEEFEGRTGLKTDLMVRDLPEKIPLDHATCLYRVLQESLQNIRKHANATAVLVRLLKTTRGVGLCVHDDGRGFNQDWERTPRKGLGLTSMAERVRALQGGFRVRTKPGDGTEVHVWIPIHSHEASTEERAGTGP